MYLCAYVPVATYLNLSQSISIYLNLSQSISISTSTSIVTSIPTSIPTSLPICIPHFYLYLSICLYGFIGLSINLSIQPSFIV